MPSISIQRFFKAGFERENVKIASLGPVFLNSRLTLPDWAGGERHSAMPSTTATTAYRCIGAISLTNGCRIEKQKQDTHR